MKTILFAEDITIHLKGKSIGHVMTTTMNTQLDTLYDWFRANKLSLNVNKTHYMLLTNSRQYPKYNSNISNDIMHIDRFEVFKFLGLYIGLSCLYKLLSTEHIVNCEYHKRRQCTAYNSWHSL